MACNDQRVVGAVFGGLFFFWSLYCPFYDLLSMVTSLVSAAVFALCILCCRSVLGCFVFDDNDIGR